MRLMTGLALSLALFAAAPVALSHNHEGGMETGETAGVTVTNAWARAALAGGNGAAYATITNAGADADKLVAVKGDVAGAIEIHEMSMTDGVMQMRKLDALEIPAGGSVELAPGGNHIMLIGLNGALEEGASVTLTFVFEKAGEKTIEVPVQKAGSGGHGGH